MPFKDDEARRRYQRQYYHGRRQRSAAEDRKCLINLRFRNSLMGRVSRLLYEGMASGSHSYKNPSEIYAALVLAGIEHWTEHGNKEAEEAAQYLRAISSAEEIGQHRREAQAAFSKVKTELSELLQIKATNQARHYYHSVLREFQKMSPNIWRDWFLREMQNGFRDLHDVGPRGVPLSSVGSVKIRSIRAHRQSQPQQPQPQQRQKKS